MGKKVTNLTIKPQVDTGALLATWDFAATTTTTTSGIKVGNLVSIASNATYYNGASMPDWVKNDKWYVIEAEGDRIVLGKNQSGTNNIISAVNSKYLTGGSSSSSSTTNNSTLDHYEVQWLYYTKDKIWYKGDSSSDKEKYSVYTPPTNATQVKVKVKPVAKTTKNSSGKEVEQWKGEFVTSDKYYTKYMPPEVPPLPDVKIEKYKLTASIENISDGKTDQIEFQIQNGNTLVNSNASPVTVKNTRVTYSYNVEAGGEYRVRCRAVNLIDGGKNYSDWTEYTSMDFSIPNTPKSIKSCKATSKTSIYLEWESSKTAKTYDIEYTEKKAYFDNTDQTTVKNGIEFTHFEFIGLETGKEYFFRVRAVNEKGESGWSSIASVIIGTKPTAPTTWSSSTTVIVGEPLTLYWLHNSEDNSRETFAQLEYTISGKSYTEEIKNTKTEDDTNKISFKELNTTAYSEGTKVKWRVRTAGTTKEFGEWSVQREANIYAPPTLTMNMRNTAGDVINTVKTYPFRVHALAGPSSQSPTGYHLTITSNETYETVDQIGNTIIINAGQQVYSKFFDINYKLEIEISATDVDLQNGVEYTLTCVTSMDSGLTAELSKTFDVKWEEDIYEPDVELYIDQTNYTANIRPYCVNEDGVLVDNVVLSVYRKEYDGTFVEIASGLNNIENVAVTDPHPALDYARYRIVAMSSLTGAVSFYDPPAQPVGGTSIVIQWNEQCTEYSSRSDDEPEVAQWSGIMLVLPYNVDVSDSHTPDVELIKYIGRSHPVSYYGTQVGKAANWSAVIERYDEETLYKIRRLANWMGDVYVREPSGSGYWANIVVSFSQKHKELTIPVSFSVTRVDVKEA